MVGFMFSIRHLSHLQKGGLLSALYLALLVGCGGGNSYRDTFFGEGQNACVPTGRGTGNYFDGQPEGVSGSDKVEIYVTEPLSNHFPSGCVTAGGNDFFSLLSGMQSLFPARSLSIFDPSDFIDSATSSIQLVVPNIAVRPDIESALVAAMGRGVSVNLVVEDFYRSQNTFVFDNLEAAGAVVVTDKNDLNTLVNSKYMIIDNDEVIFSSGNFASNSFFATSAITMRVRDTTFASCFRVDFDQMFVSNRFQDQKDASAKRCTGMIIDGRYGVDVFFGPHDSQIRQEITDLLGEIDLSLYWSNSSLSDTFLSSSLQGVQGSGAVFSGMVNGADQNGGTALGNMDIHCAETAACTHADIFGTPGVVIDFLGGTAGSIPQPFRGHNLRYFVGDPEANAFNPFLAVLSANLTESGMNGNDEVLVVIRDLQLAQWAVNGMHVRATMATELFDIDGVLVEPGLATITGTVLLSDPNQPFGDNLPTDVTVTVDSQGITAFQDTVDLTSGETGQFVLQVPVGGFITVVLSSETHKTISVGGVLMGPGVWDLGTFRMQISDPFGSGGGGA